MFQKLLSLSSRDTVKFSFDILKNSTRARIEAMELLTSYLYAAKVTDAPRKATRAQAKLDLESSTGVRSFASRMQMHGYMMKKWEHTCRPYGLYNGKKAN